MTYHNWQVNEHATLVHPQVILVTMEWVQQLPKNPTVQIIKRLRQTDLGALGRLDLQTGRDFQDNCTCRLRARTLSENEALSLRWKECESSKSVQGVWPILTIYCVLEHWHVTQTWERNFINIRGWMKEAKSRGKMSEQCFGGAKFWDGRGGRNEPRSWRDNVINPDHSSVFILYVTVRCHLQLVC